MLEVRDTDVTRCSALGDRLEACSILFYCKKSPAALFARRAKSVVFARLVVSPLRRGFVPADNASPEEPVE
jgi:hypothetical protein